MNIFKSKIDLGLILLIIMFYYGGAKMLISKNIGVPGSGLHYSMNLSDNEAYLLGFVCLAFATYCTFVVIKHYILKK
jgi:hypothetical protein